MNNVKALRALDDASRAAVADALKKATYERNARVVTKGDPGDRFFVVADGELDVVDPDSPVVVADSSQTKTQGKLLARLTSGDAFGERALTSRNDVRQATVTVSSSHADLYYLERDEFDALLGSYAHGRKWLAFRNVPALASVSDQDLHEITAHVTEKTFEDGQTVCSFGANADEMFVVESGCVRVFSDDAEKRKRDDEEEKETFSVGEKETSRSFSSRSAGRLLRAGEWFGERALMGAETTRHRSHRRRGIGIVRRRTFLG